MTLTSSLKKTPPHRMPLILTICGSQKVIGSKQLAIFVLHFLGLNTKEFFLNTVFLKFPRASGTWDRFFKCMLNTQL